MMNGRLSLAKCLLAGDLHIYTSSFGNCHRIKTKIQRTNHAILKKKRSKAAMLGFQLGDRRQVEGYGNWLVQVLSSGIIFSFTNHLRIWQRFLRCRKR